LFYGKVLYTALTMEHVFSPCTWYRDLVESRGGVPPEWIRELNLNVSTDKFLSAERGFTYTDLYAMVLLGLCLTPAFGFSPPSRSLLGKALSFCDNHVASRCVTSRTCHRCSCLGLQGSVTTGILHARLWELRRLLVIAVKQFGAKRNSPDPESVPRDQGVSLNSSSFAATYCAGGGDCQRD
jgi:hypothetical protein